MKNARTQIFSNPEAAWLRGLTLAALALAVAWAPFPAAAQADDPGARTPAPPDLTAEEIERFEDVDVPAFARVRDAGKGLRVVREDGYEEEVSRNAALYVGDTLRTTELQRAEVQFPDGELVRIDRASELEIYAIADPADLRGDRSTLVGLARGSLQASVPDPRSGDGYRVDTPSASVYPLVASRFRVDVELGGDIRVSVERGRVEVAGEAGSRVLETGERVRVRAGQGPGRPYRYNVMVGDSFDDWVVSRDEAYELAQAPGPEYEELPDEVRPYYSELSANGEWVETDEYGWVWNPSTDDDWRPYYDGEWADGPWGPVWVSDVSWSWPVYRYGRWEYTAYGWSWIPGRVFRPAHVYWYYGPDYVGWCPIGYYNRPVYIGAGFSFSLGFYWGHSWFDYHPWTFVHHNHFYHHHVHRVYVDRHRVVGRHLDRGYVTRRGVVGRRAHRDANGVRVRGGGSRDAYDEFSRGGRRGARRAETLRGDARERSERSERLNAGRSRVSGGRSFRDYESRTLRARAERGDRSGRNADVRAGRGRSSTEVSRRDGASGSRSRGTSSGSVGSRSGSSSGGSKAGRTRGRGSAPNASDDRPIIRIRRPDQGGDRGAVRRNEPSAGARTRSENAGRARRERSEQGAATRPARSTRSFERRSEGRGREGREAGERARPRSRSEEGVKRFLGQIGESSRSSDRSRERAERPTRSRTPTRNEGSARSSTSRTRDSRSRVERPSSSRSGSRPSARSAPSRDRSRGSVGTRPRSAPKSPQKSRPSVGSRSKSGGSKSTGRSRPSVGSRSKSGGSKSTGRSRGSVGSRSKSGGSKSTGRSRGGSSKSRSRGKRR